MLGLLIKDFGKTQVPSSTGKIRISTAGRGQMCYVNIHDTGDLMRSFQVIAAQVMGNTVLFEDGFIEPSKKCN